AAGVDARRLQGIDVDPHAVGAARARRTGAKLVVADFLDGNAPRGVAGVVGNPPYVRQERLGPATKARIRESLAADWPDLPALSGRADLAMAFLARALRCLVPGGRVGFVMSAALLDADYADLATLLRGRGRLAHVVGSPRERWFPDAAVHGVIVIVEKTAG